jgi:hypothetical protein
MSLTMKREIAEELSKRLKSGDYKQGDAFLCQTNVDNDGELYCCLGVLSEMAAEAGVVHTWERAGQRYYAEPSVPVGADDGWYGRTLAPAVVEWAGMKSPHNADEDEYGYRIDDYEGVGRFAQFSYEQDAYVVDDLRTINLASMNDSGIPFETIAEFIDEKVVKA